MFHIYAMSLFHVLKTYLIVSYKSIIAVIINWLMVSDDGTTITDIPAPFAQTEHQNLAHRLHIVVKKQEQKLSTDPHLSSSSPQQSRW